MSTTHSLPPRVNSSTEESSPDETKKNPKESKKEAKKGDDKNTKKDKKSKKDGKKAKKVKKDEQDIEPLPGDHGDDDDEENPSDLDGVEDLLTLKEGKKNSSHKGQKRPAASGPLKRPAKKQFEGEKELKVGSTYGVLTWENQNEANIGKILIK